MTAWECSFDLKWLFVFNQNNCIWELICQSHHLAIILVHVRDFIFLCMFYLLCPVDHSYNQHIRVKEFTVCWKLDHSHNQRICVKEFTVCWKQGGIKLVLIPVFGGCSCSLIAFYKRVNFFGLNTSGHCLVRVRMLHYLHVGLCITITQSHTHTMSQMHMHKAVTRCVETKKLLSC